MNWSAEDALNRMWSEMDANVTNGEMRAFFKRHLQAAHDANLAAAQTRIAALKQALATCDGALEPFADLASHRVIDDALSFDKTHHGPAGLLISRGFGTAPISSGAFRAAREARSAAKATLDE